MKRVISTERIPIKLWVDDLEEEAMNQVKNLADFPFALNHIPVLPDCHTGYGMPIGSVLATNEVVVPNAVGVDIGCGMCALKTRVESISYNDLKKVLGRARKAIPVGSNWHSKAQDGSLMPSLSGKMPVVRENYEKATKQLGTLGGGNHFIEIQKGSNGFIWYMIHSGSRNLGYRVAGHYNALAENANERYACYEAKKKGLAFLFLETEEAKSYLKEMEFCIEFALANRKLMMDRLIEATEAVIGAISFGDMINGFHNFAAWERHFNQEMLIHRKGATRAYEGELGMIPGSQGSKSYIVRGLGNPESFRSCSHGAGRTMGRRQAQRELDMDQEVACLDEQGVIHAIRHKRDLDEAPGAYKDINTVMENQKDLCEIVTELSPLAVMKG